MKRACTLNELTKIGCRTAQIDGRSIALFLDGGEVCAIDNRCPHMGFPLDKGSVKDGILTCHWHHARFDLRTGGTFDLWADDVHTYPVRIEGDEVHVDLSWLPSSVEQDQERLRRGLERNIPLILAKGVLGLLDRGENPAVAFRVGVEFGSRNRQQGWGAGLTAATCMMNLVPALDSEDRARALYHGLSAVATETSGAPPRFAVQPLPGSAPDLDTLKRWFRQFVEVRDSDGAERCIVSALRAGAGPTQVADMLFSGVTDYRYLDTGHVADFTNKAMEALDMAGWRLSEPVLASLAPVYTDAHRMEESNSWRHPVDLVAILNRAFENLAVALETGRAHADEQSRTGGSVQHHLVDVLLGDDPQAIADALLTELTEGAAPSSVSSTVAYAAALRIARFHTSNEFSDWDSALHSFTFANAVDQAVRRVQSFEVMRGVFDAAMSIYLNRFLNIPPAPLQVPKDAIAASFKLLEQLPILLDQQQQVQPASNLIALYLAVGGEPDCLLAQLGRLLLREDRNFHTIQMMEAAFRQYGQLGRTAEGTNVLIAAARYLAAHAPTVRSQEQTFAMARRLHRGDLLYEEALEADATR